jgi:oxalate decarboxylase/phosphoglucose isomerase-like protein (cupin superfamily)
MAKIDLKKSSGFSLFYENEDLITQDLSYSRHGSVTIDDIRIQLLNQELSYPETFYYKYLKLDHEGILENKGVRFNIYIVPPNLAGIEYVKTRAMKLPKHPKIMEVLHGGGTIIMQKFRNSHEGDVIVAKVKKDQKIIVPPGYATTVVNTRQSTLVISEVYSNEIRQISVLDDMQGLAYYVIRKNAKQEIVRNPRYKGTPSLRKVKWEKVLSDKNITLKTPIIKQILRKHDKFEWLFKENSIEI